MRLHGIEARNIAILPGASRFIGTDYTPKCRLPANQSQFDSTGNSIHLTPAACCLLAIRTISHIRTAHRSLKFLPAFPPM